MELKSQYSLLDAALVRLHAFAPEYSGGLADHGPMVAEAMCALGRGDAAQSWVERYVADLEPHPPAGTALRDEEWHRALGDPAAYPRWLARMEREITESSAHEVFRCWIGVLAPGFSAAAAHGAIRTAHALRALRIEETPARKAELARGMAYWACQYEELPGWELDVAPLERPPLEILSRIPTVAPGRDHRPGFIVEGLRGLATLEPFRPVVGWLDPRRGESSLLDLGEALALAFVAQSDRRIIAFTHMLTGFQAALELARHADAHDRPLVIRGAWHTAAALVAAFGNSTDLPEALSRAERSLESAPLNPEAIREGALANGAEHSIKLAESALRAHHSRPSRVWLEVGRIAVQRIHG
ncbi:MAG: DUF4243 domain-containing protein [Planctomycetes bacterium]|nr:DUF4243 domain-containing protein [Planctomycetota bacterium]